jgi:hypothetical protein
MSTSEVTLAEHEKYRHFVSAIAQEMGVFGFDPEEIVWHYTTGEGLLGIIESGTIFATQVACLNDKSEIRYATELYRSAINHLIAEKEGETVARTFLNQVLEYMKENPDSPTHGISKFFVACFSGVADDLNQWTRYGKRRGYAIGFFARGLNRTHTSKLFKVVYNRPAQENAAAKLARGTLDFFLEGLQGDRTRNPDEWGANFFTAWDEWIYRLAPLAKDPVWLAESEFRLVHELSTDEFSEVRFQQRETMLSRYIPLATPSWVKRRVPLLPIAKIVIGPGNHPVLTRISITLLLEQMGYAAIPIEATRVPFQDV